MRFVDTPIEGVVVVEPDLMKDERGFFARTHSVAEFEERGLLSHPIESSVSYNSRPATLRGLHYQAEPRPDPKLVRCTSGSMFDVAVDLRVSSPTYCQWFGITLSSDTRTALHVPAGCAHGFVTLKPHTEVFYMIGEEYDPTLARGVRWDDDAFAIDWPIQPQVMSSRDRDYPDYTRANPM